MSTGETTPANPLILNMQVAYAAILLLLCVSRSTAGLLGPIDIEIPPILPFSCRPAKVNINTILPKATIDWNSLTVSGFSSGAIMASQVAVALSSEVKGAGILAGLTYGQYYNNPFPVGALRFISGAIPYTPLPVLSAVLDPALPYAPVSQLETQAAGFATFGSIDSLNNLNGRRIFVYSGVTDLIVNNTNGYRVAKFFNDLGANVATDLNHEANHVMGTDNFPTPLTLSCAALPNILTDGVENCGYQLVFNMFSHLFGSSYVAPASSTTAATGTFSAFDQTTLTASGNNVADFMDSVGYLYVPARCNVAGNTCKIHIALHGCLSSVYNDAVCNFFATNSGYFQVADANDLVIVFPQAAQVELSLTTTQTNNVCWDFYGGVSADFCFKTGTHIASIRKIAAKVAGVT